MFKLKFTAILFVILFFANKAFATEQYLNRIFYDGREFNLISDPMEDYFKRFPDKKPKNNIRSIGLRRGYVATFEIVDNALFLKDIEIEIRVTKNNTDKSFDTDWKSVLAEVVADGKRLKIEWFTGILVLPMSDFSTADTYVLIEVANGDFKKVKEFNAEQYAKFKERQFEAFKKTDEYKNLVEDLKKKENATETFAGKLPAFPVNSEFLRD